MNAISDDIAERTDSLHQCRVCGTYWRLWLGNGGWSLADAKQLPGKCCDNADDFLGKLVPFPAVSDEDKRLSASVDGFFSQDQPLRGIKP